ncbi:TSCPD domain-containing protein [Desulfotalea psychrophila]|nr:hypothetical protein [Desulfotalea psychrophila]
MSVKIKICPLCKKENRTEENICSVCAQVCLHLERNLELSSRLKQLADQSDGQEEIEEELPDVLDAVRYRTCDRDNNTWYISISELSRQPVEIFASTAFDNDHHLQSKISNLTTITRLISLILRHIFMGERLSLEKTIMQIERSSRQKNDLPEMLSKVLGNYAQKRRQ